MDELIAQFVKLQEIQHSMDDAYTDLDEYKQRFTQIQKCIEIYKKEINKFK